MAQRDLVVRIIGDNKSILRAFASTSRSAKTFDRDMGRVTRGAIAGSGALGGLGKSLAFASGGFISAATAVGLIRTAFAELNESRKVAAQTNAVLRSTGQIAGVTARHVEELGNELLRKTGIDDEAIKSAANLLLTFTNVRNVLGEGNNVFDQATVAILDMSAAMGDDLEGATIRVGKALQDPIRGATALRRVGVQLTESQERQIRAFVRAGRVMDAQRIILRELRREFGGSAAAAGRVQPWNLLRETITNLSGVIAEKFLPTIIEATDRLQRWLDNPANTDRVIRDAEGVASAFAGVVSALDEANTKGNAAMESLRETVGKAGFETRRRLLGPFENLPGPIGDWAERERAEAVAKLRALSGDVRIIAVDMRRELEEALILKNRPRVEVPTGARPPGGAGIRTGLTPEQRNRFFDNDLARALDRVQDSELRDQISKLNRISALITARIRVTKDVTRKLNLEDQLLDVRRRIKAIRSQIADDLKAAAADARQALEDAGQALIDALQFGLTKAQVTASFADDLAALDALRDGLRKRVAAEGESLDLTRQLFETEQQRLAVLRARRDARQFRALGLGPTGEERIPGLTALRRQLGNVTDAVKGTFLDTTKTRSLMATIRKILAGGMGAVSEDVRAKVKEMLDDINQQLKDANRQRTRFRVADTSAMLAGLGLDPEQIRALRGRIAQIGRGGTVPTRGTSAFGIGFASGGGGGNIVISGLTVKADNPDAFMRELQKTARRTAAQRGGRMSGRALGLS